MHIGRHKMCTNQYFKIIIKYNKGAYNLDQSKNVEVIAWILVSSVLYAKYLSMSAN